MTETSSEIRCPKCGSNQITADKKGFSGTKAVAGAVLTGGIGLLAGTIGSNKVKITCLACGHQFKPGQDKAGMEAIRERNAEIKKGMPYKMLKYLLFALLGFFGLCIVIAVLANIFNSSKPSNAPSSTIELTQIQKDSVENVKRLAKIEDRKQQVKDSISAKKDEIKWNNSKAGKVMKFGKSKNKDWSKEDCELVAENKIWIGMDIYMVVYERGGNPNTVNPSNYGGGTQYQWCWDGYRPSCFYGGEDNIVTSYN